VCSDKNWPMCQGQWVDHTPNLIWYKQKVVASLFSFLKVIRLKCMASYGHELLNFGGHFHPKMGCDRGSVTYVRRDLAHHNLRKIKF
jgi:hypothetical protein